MAPVLLTVKEVAELLRVTPRAVYERLRRNPKSLPGVVRVGRRLYFERAKLLRAIGIREEGTRRAGVQLDLWWT